MTSGNSPATPNNVVKRKRSGEYSHKKAKKVRKTATPKIPLHLLHKKPFMNKEKRINVRKEDTSDSDDKSGASGSTKKEKEV